MRASVPARTLMRQALARERKVTFASVASRQTAVPDQRRSKADRPQAAMRPAARLLAGRPLRS